MNEIKILTMPSVIGTAFLVIGGYYGNGEERVERLEAEGFDYNRVQDCVNDLLKLCEKYEA